MLADGNVLIALVVAEHLHHDAAVAWFDLEEPRLATCPITEGTLLRFLLREGVDTGTAMAALETLRAQPWHEFWEDSIPYRVGDLRGVIGHRQVTDAYLVSLARSREDRVVTFDRGLHLLHPEHTVLLSGAGDAV